ncbi:aminotransferase class III-fold pyridoxal phosphate-dependent enzyme [Micromonospora sp. NPDC023888]|uniref:aminotransferase class III-fold pyridoxal phosphate-dependent enzyme n=1 Tax=Micromonospora sp. NPDC023888 TaxID=3155607 RepID=UPI00340471B6
MRSQRQRLAESKAAHNHPTYATMSFVMGCGVQGEGSDSFVADEDGARLLALFDQYGNQSFGYSHPRLIGAIEEQLGSRRLNSTKIMFEEVQIRLTARLAEVTEGRLPYAYLANGGGESIDNALKLARAATRRPGFVTAVDCFHGKTFATLSASGRPEHAALFRPFMDGFQQVPFGDLDALDRAVGTDTAAVLLEPVQAEAGVVLPPEGYLAEVRRICDERGALLILDEMQTAFGRCGALFAYQLFDVAPDLVCIGKAFGGGIVPISAVLGTARVWESLRDQPSTFGSSLGGNPLASRVGLEVLEIATADGFVESVVAKGALITERLAAMVARHPRLLSAHRGVGMMHGLEFHDESLGGMVLGELLSRRVTSTYSLYNNRVLRVQPPMVISTDDLVAGLAVLDEVLDTLDGAGGPVPVRLPPLTRTVSVALSPDELAALLHERPHLLDPFAADPAATRGAVEPDFAGTLGGRSARWTDRVELTPDGVVLRADPDWLWNSLERSVHWRPDGAGGSALTIRLDWDAGTGPYEPMLGGHLGRLAHDRLDTLLTQLRQPARRHRREGTIVKLTSLIEHYRDNTDSVVVEIDAAGDRREISHAELANLAERRAAELRAAGVRPGDVVGLRAPNSIDWLAWDLGALLVGAVLQAFPDDFPVDDVPAFIGQHGLALLVLGEETYPGDPGRPAPHTDPDLHSLVYSSGTSGLLKGLRISGKGTEYVIQRFIDSFDVTSGDRHLIFLPLANYQQRLSVYCCLWTGADLVLAPYQRVFAALRAEKPTFLIGPPIFYDAVLQLAATSGAGMPLGEFLGGRLRFAITGMAPIGRKTMDAYWSQDVPLLEAYGMTESGMIGWNTLAENRPGTVGKLIDPDAVTMLADGELLIHRPAPLSIGYFGLDQQVAEETFRPDGTIVTGDYGRLDEDGYLTLLGRKKDVIALASGRKVHPGEVESHFAGVPGLADLIVVPTPNSHGLAAIGTATDDDDGQRAAIVEGIAKVNEQLDGQYRLTAVLFSAKPLRSDPAFLTANLKLSRAAAAAYYAERRDSAVPIA